jgi:hypothetical protein
MARVSAVSSIMEKQHTRSKQSWLDAEGCTMYRQRISQPPHTLGASRDAAYSGILQTLQSMETAKCANRDGVVCQNAPTIFLIFQSRPPRSFSPSVLLHIFHLHSHMHLHRQRRRYSTITDTFFLFCHCGSTTRHLQVRQASISPQDTTATRLPQHTCPA